MRKPKREANTFLTRLFTRGLADERYEVKRYKSTGARSGSSPPRRALGAGGSARPPHAGRSARCGPPGTNSSSARGSRSPEAGCSCGANTSSGAGCSAGDESRETSCQPAAGHTNPLHAKETPMPYKDRERERERHKRRAADRRARGACPKCGKNPPAPGRSLCESCREARREAERKLYAERRAGGLCGRCGAEVIDKASTCASCAARDAKRRPRKNAASRARYRDRRAHKRCVDCALCGTLHNAHYVKFMVMLSSSMRSLFLGGLRIVKSP